MTAHRARRRNPLRRVAAAIVAAIEAVWFIIVPAGVVATVMLARMAAR